MIWTLLALFIVVAFIVWLIMKRHYKKQQTKLMEGYNAEEDVSKRGQPQDVARRDRPVSTEQQYSNRSEQQPEGDVQLAGPELLQNSNVVETGTNSHSTRKPNRALKGRFKRRRK